MKTIGALILGLIIGLGGAWLLAPEGAEDRRLEMAIKHCDQNSAHGGQIEDDILVYEFDGDASGGPYLDMVGSCYAAAATGSISNAYGWEEIDDGYQAEYEDSVLTLRNVEGGYRLEVDVH